MSWRFAVEAADDPQTLLRVLGFFAQRWIVPVGVTMTLRDGVMAIDVEIEDLNAPSASIIALKLQENVLVARVVLTEVERSVREPQVMLVDALA